MIALAHVGVIPVEELLASAPVFWVAIGARLTSRRKGGKSPATGGGQVRVERQRRNWQRDREGQDGHAGLDATIFEPEYRSRPTGPPGRPKYGTSTADLRHVQLMVRIAELAQAVVNVATHSTVHSFSPPDGPVASAPA